MAKQTTSKSGTSRIRFIMLEAEIPEGDLGEITAAIQNALKPTTTIIQQRIPAAPPSAVLPSIPNRGDEMDDVAVELEQEHDLEVSPTPRRPRESKPRKPVAMKVLELDLNSAPSFESFANEHPAKNDTERNLVVLAWFKEHRPDEIVTPHHVYTCYRAMKWPSGIDDFSATLRQLKHKQLVSSPGRSQFVINHLGIARVEELGRSG